VLDGDGERHEIREGSSSFLKKRTKKLLLDLVRVDRGLRVNQSSKSFLVLFFKKELLPAFFTVSASCAQAIPQQAGR
jgi:hypothetical protein